MRKDARVCGGIDPASIARSPESAIEPYYAAENGLLFEGDCLEFLAGFRSTCRHCGGEIRDYGGHRDAMNPRGVNLKDVWSDIPPVRHWKFKSRRRPANALSTKILDRVIEMTTSPGELVLDPFGGSGTTYAVCERRQRRWIGVELDFCRDIVDRLKSGAIDHHRNDDVVDEQHIKVTGWPAAAD